MRRRAHPYVLVFFAAASGSAIVASCSATSQPNDFTSASSSGDASSGAGLGGAGMGGAGMGGTTSVGSGDGGGFVVPDAGMEDAPADVFVNPCGTACGPVERCDEDHVGLDDDCDGEVDEICSCNAGQAHFCFKGDPSFHGINGCFDGTMKCSENGQWGGCIGGTHATDNCFANDTSLCHPISASPFQDVDLKEGTGDFSLNAVAGSEVWTVECPVGVDPCPGVAGFNPADDFKPLQSGEYKITYTKGLPGGGTDTCQYPLYVGAPGLRIELQWEHDLGGSGVDLDLHVHQPNNTLPWSISGDPQDCTWSNCVFDDFESGNSSAPNWFPMGVMPPDPVNWYADPVLEKNTCYFAPRGVGQDWQNYGQGCHNPRLDLDNITCDPASTDPDDGDFCAPENVNVDFPPQSDWTRVAVHYYSSHGHPYDVHPTVKIFCNGALAAELGPQGYYDPETPVTFASYDGEGSSDENRFWLVADVAFKESKCGSVGCVVKPLYSDPATKTPFLTFASAAETKFGPAYPPPP
jgi:hypothetical protein